MRTQNLFQALAIKKSIIISPHPDDASFSMGGVLAANDKPATLIITVFSRSKAGPGNDEETVSATRAKEDDAFAAMIGARLIRLDLPDSSLRSDEVIPELNIDQDATVFVPLGIGDHPDHILCRKANFSNANIIFYEDLPYCEFVGGPAVVKDIVNREHPTLHEIHVRLSPAQMKNKLHGLDVYKSQLHPKWRKDIEQYAIRLVAEPGAYAERYWASPQAFSKLP